MNNNLEANKHRPFGLTQQEVQAYRTQYGKNELVPSTLTSQILEMLKFLKDPMGLMMLALALIYFLLGEKKDALIMLLAFIPVSAVDVFLEVRAHRALKALKASFQRTAKVFREGQLIEIPIVDIVPFDWVALEEGQTIPADGVIQSSAHLSISEAALTGESVPIEKNESMEVYAGTIVLNGRGIFLVQQTGSKTKFGKIVELLQEAEEGKSPLQMKVQHLVGQVFKIAAVLVLCLFFLEWFRGKSFLESLLISLTFGMASVPEEFPLVFTLYLSLGAWRLAKSGVLVKALPSVETLGSVNVICTDKTGTLTEGKFQLNDIVSFSKLSSDEQWKFALLACEPVVVDSMELAIKEKSPIKIDLHDWQLVHDYPFEVDGKHMSHAWTNKAHESFVAMKGSIEGVLSHCKDSAEIKKQIIKKTEELSSLGFRLLGLAGKTSKITGIREQDEEGLTFIGIIIFSDPIRDSAKKAIEVCQREGIKIKMITGDHPLTAHAIADQLNLEHSHEALYTGYDLKQFNDSERAKAYREGAIFSRVTPEQKYELIQLLKNEGMVVAMTGDGVNDAPAMKIADIGISMGENATDAARSTAKMVLTKSDFNGIVHAITEGRKIFANLKRSFSYLISFHVPVVLLSFIPPLFNLGEILMPIHIILLELIVHPVSAFTFENFKSSPKQSNSNIIDKKTALTSTLAGILVSFAALLMFRFQDELSLEQKRTLALTTILFGNMGFILLETFPLFTKRLGITIILLFALIAVIHEIPMVADFLHFSPVDLSSIFYCFILGLLASIPSWLMRKKE
jgi:Ca2+-transporting ATPase